MILAKTEYQYPFATVYYQKFTFYTFQKGSTNNTEWYENFNVEVDVSESIRVTQQHKALLEYLA